MMADRNEGAARPERKKPFWAMCLSCDHRWPAAYFPLEAGAFAKIAMKGTCPRCGAGKAVIPKQKDGTLIEPGGYPALPWLPISSAPQQGHVILRLGECIPGVPYVRTGCFITAHDAAELGEDPAQGDGWLIWSERAEDWSFEPLSVPTGWLPMPEENQ